MNAIDKEKLVKALRCSIETTKGNCEECPYRTLEQVDTFFPAPPDVTIDGIDYWEGCGYDEMALDAAEVIEEMLKKLEM